ncbi:MAG: hypothetical protein ABW185_08225 [Sedimenticola sp.]
MNSLAEFFIYLFEEKKFSPSAVRGYRSAITSTLRQSSQTDYSNQPLLSEVIRSFELERPRVAYPVPKWDLALVLRAISVSPFEPLSDCSLRLLTLKSVFLLALASGRRRSELHALSAADNAVSFAADGSSVLLHVFPGFLAKNQLPSVAYLPMEIPGLQSVEGSDATSVLCPVRALRIYLHRVSDLRRGRRRLFISFLEHVRNEISASTVSRWIVQTVRTAYELADKSAEHVQVNAHEVRALANSWSWLNSTPLDQVLRAGYWSVENAFIKFYLRDMSPQSRALFALGPLVSAQTVIKPPSSHN